ncbi:hypothetical protein HDK77DRAFT_437766 [Phyllosticta capitalensis]
MATNDREERRRMRQRGAGTSGITGLNFGFTFGASASTRQPTPRRTPRAPSNPQTSQRTPQPIPRSSRRSSSKKATPASRSSQRAPGSQKGSSSRKTPRGRSASADIRPQDGSSSSRSAASARLPPVVPETDVATPTIASSGRKRKRATPVLEAPQEEEEDDLEQNDEAYQMSSVKSNRVQSAQRLGSAGRQITPSAMMDEPQDELASHDGSHVLSSAKSGRAPGSSNLESTVNGAGQHIASPLETVKRQRGRPRKSSGNASALLDEAPSSAAAPKKRGRPPKTQAAQKGGQETAATVTPLPAKRSARRNIPEPEVLTEEGDESLDELGEESHSDLARSGEIRVGDAERPPRASRPSFHQEEPEEDYAPSREPSPERPTSNKAAQAKQVGRPAKPKPQKARSIKTKAKRKRTSEGETGEIRTIPITVYRLSKAPPSVEEDGEDDLANPRLQAPIGRVPGVNAVDVLAEFMSEKMEDISTKLRDGIADEADKAQRSKLKRRTNTIEEFARELDSQLLQLREATYAGESLKARLKSTRKRREALTQEFLDIRKERDDIALRMDAVRQQHEEAETKRQSEEDLNAAIFDIELAVQRGKQKAEREDRQDEAPEMPLHWLLDDVAASVSTSGSGGGLLQKVKGFNVFLEQVAGVLEGRA